MARGVSLSTVGVPYGFSFTKNGRSKRPGTLAEAENLWCNRDRAVIRKGTERRWTSAAAARILTMVPVTFPQAGFRMVKLLRTGALAEYLPPDVSEASTSILTADYT